MLATHELIELIGSQFNSFSEIPLYRKTDTDVDMSKGSPSGWGFLELME